jgi:hypothetical protein
MTDTPLRDGVLQLLAAARSEEWTLHRILDADDKARVGDSEANPEVTELLARANASRRTATQLLHKLAAGQSVDDCAEVATGPVGTWEATHADAHEAMSGLTEAVTRATEEHLSEGGGRKRNHPQYLWRDVVIYAVRGPMGSYAQWYLRRGRAAEGIGVLSRFYEAVRATALPTKALSDASYDLACGYARAGRLDEAMRYLPDAFVYNDRAAVPVLKAWAREDPDLAPLTDRADFRTLVGASA